MLRLNCFFQAKSEADYKRALDAAIVLTEKSQNHEGNIAYDVFQSATRSDVFLFCETWANQQALDKHAETPEFVENFAIIESCGAVKLEKFEF